MLRCWMFSCTSTHTSCYAAGCSFALPHIRHATLLDALSHFHTYVMLCCWMFLHFHAYVMLRCWMFSSSSTHMSFYASGCSLALPHICHATLLDVLWHFHTYVRLRCWMFSCTSTHTSCYAAGCCLALPHMRQREFPERPRPTLCLKSKKINSAKRSANKTAVSCL